jgi:hypothetical protein
MEVVVYEMGQLAETVGHALTAAPRLTPHPGGRLTKK